MSVTFTSNYKEIFSKETVTKIEELVEDNYALDDIVEFIDENSEEDFINYYEEYVEQGENVGYDVVDAFVEEFGLSYVEHAEDAYFGTYSSKAEFAEEFITEAYSIPDCVVIDWEETFEQSLTYDFTIHTDGYVFRSTF